MFCPVALIEKVLRTYSEIEMTLLLMQLTVTAVAAIEYHRNASAFDSCTGKVKLKGFKSKSEVAATYIHHSKPVPTEKKILASQLMTVPGWLNALTQGVLIPSN